MEEELVTMSARERDRLRVVEAVAERRLKQSRAAQLLGLSVRQIKRLVRAFRAHGARGLGSQRRGRPSNRRIDRAEQERVIATVREHYRDFGPTLAMEYLQERHGFSYSRETLRQWMIQAQLWQDKRVRRKRAFQLRERRAAEGELVQIDGSPHDWLEERGPRCTLIAFIDDATGKLQYGSFEPAETSRAYLHGLRAYVSQYGRPVAFYSDRHSIFGKHDPEDPTPTQFERAVRALDIEPILALSPQAKGRVERAFQTLQDRLVKALRLAGVDSIESANAFLSGFIARYNQRFGRAPREPAQAHRPLSHSAQQLLWITSEQHSRKLSKSLSCQYRGRLYLIQTGGAPAYRLRGARITVCDDGRDETIVLLHQGKPLPYRVFQRHDLPPRIADDKTVNAMVEAAKQSQAAALPRQKTKSGQKAWRRDIAGDVAAAARVRAARSGRPNPTA
jgi:transposase